MGLLRPRQGRSVRDSTNAATVISSHRPSRARRIVWFSSSLTILTSGSTLFAAQELEISGAALWVVAGISAGIAAACGLRSSLVGVKVYADGITVINMYRTIHIPYSQIHAFEWRSPSPGYRRWKFSGSKLTWNHTPIGLSVVWGHSEGPHGVRRTFVDAFNRRSNPTADLTRGYETWNNLQSLRVLESPPSPESLTATERADEELREIKRADMP